MCYLSMHVTLSALWKGSPHSGNNWQMLSRCLFPGDSGLLVKVGCRRPVVLWCPRFGFGILGCAIRILTGGVSYPMRTWLSSWRLRRLNQNLQMCLLGCRRGAPQPPQRGGASVGGAARAPEGAAGRPGAGRAAGAGLLRQGVQRSGPKAHGHTDTSCMTAPCQVPQREGVARCCGRVNQHHAQPSYTICNVSATRLAACTKT